MYALSFLTILITIQLNIIARKKYLNSIDQGDKMTFESERKYLTFSWYLLHKGIEEIYQRVLYSARKVLDG